MKATEVQRQPADPIKEPFATYLALSAVAHGMLVVCMIGGVWLWRAPTPYKPPSYTVALVDAPLGLRQLAPSSGGKKPSSKQEKPRKQQVSPSSASKPRSKKPAAAPMQVASPQKEKKPPTTAPKRTKKTTSSAKRHVSTQKRIKPPKRASTKAAKARKTVQKSRQRQTNKAKSASKANQAKQRAVEQRLAALREHFGGRAVGDTAAEATAGLQEVRLRAYQELVREQVIDAWILPMPQEEAQKLQATALLTLDRAGRITQLELLKSSGNPLFDESLLRAIKQAAPLPTLPESYGGEILEVELRFRAGGT